MVKRCESLNDIPSGIGLGDFLKTLMRRGGIRR